MFVNSCRHQYES